MSLDSLADAALGDAPSESHHSASGDYELKEVLVRMTNVTLSYEGRLILKPTNIEVKDVVRPGCTQGQVVGILGPSGIGKTQFSRILAGLKNPTNGEVFVSNFAADPSGKILQPVREGLVGMVAQSYPLFMHRTVLGNLLVALEHTKLSTKERIARAMEYLTTFELTDKANLYPAQLSGGQRQRVAIIRELLCSEHFLIMDEPFTGLDPIMKENVCELINKVSLLDERNTIFVVAHDIAALVQIADTLWLFGRDRDEQGAIIPGATIKKEFNLIDRGLAWRPDIVSTRQFADFVTEVRQEFKNL